MWYALGSPTPVAIHKTIEQLGTWRCKLSSGRRNKKREISFNAKLSLVGRVDECSVCELSAGSLLRCVGGGGEGKAEIRTDSISPHFKQKGGGVYCLVWRGANSRVGKERGKCGRQRSARFSLAPSTGARGEGMWGTGWDAEGQHNPTCCLGRGAEVPFLRDLCRGAEAERNNIYSSLSPGKDVTLTLACLHSLGGGVGQERVWERG